jgi:hypothetical protein
MLMKRSRPRRGVVLLASVAFLTILLFFFEWLGSEQSETWVEKPVVMPKTVVQPDGSKE